MHNADTKELKALADYLEKSRRRGVDGIHDVEPCGNVTALMYFFWQRTVASEKWPSFEGALLETWRHCGLLKTVIVANEPHPCLLEFARRHDNVELQNEPALIPGDINSMSIDCNSRLHGRFNTEYVLIVQDDGFPLRKGLDAFIGKGYDFIGAPYCRTSAIPNLLTKILNYCPSNGGFSLRTNKLCRMTADCWKKWYSAKQFVSPQMSEDIFCTSTLPRRSLGFWLNRRQAPSETAGRFSYEGTFGDIPGNPPFGFHTAAGFSALVRAGYVSL